MTRTCFLLLILCWPAPLNVLAWETRDVALDFLQQGMRLEGTDSRQAENIYFSLIELYPQYRDVQAQAFYQLAGLYEIQGQYQAAYALYARLICYYPEQTNILQRSAWHLSGLVKFQPPGCGSAEQDFYPTVSMLSHSPDIAPDVHKAPARRRDISTFFFPGPQTP
ncbi:hypothetical protein JW933_10505 [candidate division FCPU426 bacterium]|nr:hypothetical protein [candidate division FCPU426 bacterium]